MKPGDRAKWEERSKQLQSFYHGAPLRMTLGLDLSYNDDQQAVFDLPYKEGNCHALGDVHGGVIATMLDNAGWFTVAPYYDFWVATADLSIKLVDRPNKEHLRSVGTILRLGKRVAIAEMEARSLSGRLIAKGTGTFVVTNVPTVSENK
jgi:uncharacterized protein (TIGR00369 family)